MVGICLGISIQHDACLQDLTLINFSGGVSAVLAAVKSILLRQDNARD